MKPTIKIDYVSDIACPWCAVGLGNLNQAMNQFSDKANFEIHFHPFELNPNMPLGGQDVIKNLTKKFLDIAVDILPLVQCRELLANTWHMADLPSAGDFAKSTVA